MFGLTITVPAIRRFTVRLRFTHRRFGVVLALSIVVVWAGAPTSLAGQASTEADSTARPVARPSIGAAGRAAIAASTVDEEYRHDLAPEVTAVRASGSIAVDGRLDEEAWERATPVTDFIQEVPLEGEPGTQRTEVRFLYDDDALYVGAKMFDTEPLSGRLRRRDQGRGDFDYLRIDIDSFHDHETSYQFFVNPSGTYRDAVSGRGGGADASWDPVWERAVRTTEAGWFVEIRIPFSQLRFTPDEEQVWGIHLTRNIHARQERSVFPFIPTLDRGGASRYGHLVGISGIEPGRRLELLPYAVARGEFLQLDTSDGAGFANPFRSGSEYFEDVGMDLKYRLTSNVTLDATVNPDFGQVELDPSVINLTAFETRFREQRPFFVEGADIFEVGEGGPSGSTGRGPQLVYSRRIGRAPQGAAPSDALYSEAPTATTILGAAKVTGRTSTGWSVGVLEAVTGEERAAYVDPDGVTGETVVEPLSNYFVGRLRRQIHGGDTRFGVIGWAVNRRLSNTEMTGLLHRSAYTGGFDFAHEWANRTYRIAALLTGSYVEGDPAAILRTQRSSTHYYQRPDADHLDLDPDATSLAGYLAMLDLAKLAGAFGGKVSMALLSPGYEVNDLGFQSASDRIMVDTDFRWSHPEPGRILRRWSVNGGPDGVWNYAGDRVFSEVNGNLNLLLLDYWGGGLRLGYDPVHDDDRLTRGGPMARTPRKFTWALHVDSDSRRDVRGQLNYSGSRDESGGWSQRLGLGFTANPNDQVEIQIGPRLDRNVRTAQYVTSVSDDLANLTFGQRYVFADLDQTTVSLQTRLNLTLTPDLSLQLYVEPFFSAGDYEGLKEFARPGTFNFNTYGREVGTVAQDADGSYTVDPDGPGPASPFTVANRDYSYRSLLGNAVLRWEWRQGSTLYVVWQQRRISSLTNRGPDGTDGWVGDFDLGRDTGDILDLRPDNIFAIKVNYWLNP